MPAPVARRIRNRLLATAVWLVVGVGLGAAAVLGPRRGDLTVPLLALASLGTALFLMFRAVRAACRLQRGLEWVRTAVLNVVADRQAVIPVLPESARTPEVTMLLQALARYQGQITRERLAPDRRLVAVLGAVNSGVVVATETGQVSLVNGAARQLLGAGRVRVGTSLFAALSRESVGKALAKAQKAGRTLETVVERLDGVELQGRVTALPDQEGCIIFFPPVELREHRPEVEFDLGLHDVPPAREPLGLDTPLADLPIIILDTETTGLNAAADRVVSLGAVCAHGTRLFRSRMMDDLINPGTAIPPASTAVHRITDEMVAEAPAWPAVYPDLQRLMHNRVVVGHSLPFDLTLMRHECLRHGLEWEPPVFIDTLRLAALLNPALKDLDLENLARVYHIELRGRHTALGDALVTAELFFRMMPRLEMQGFKTLEDLLHFHCKEPVEIIAKQREAGWDLEQPQALRQAWLEGRAHPEG